ncbi:MAG: DUF1538 domain-containing protein [Clostridiales bacterium]|nr:DUF1538 domain-containing protein [Clostridiales bacterium]
MQKRRNKLKPKKAPKTKKEKRSRKIKPPRLDRFHHHVRDSLTEKWRESLASVLPVVLIVLALCFVFVPAPVSALLGFLLGGVMLIVGMGLFTLGTDLAMTPIGEEVGVSITRSKKLWLILLIAFLVGLVVTISEPDLQVLAQQVPGIPNMTLILMVALGVGVFLVLSFLRILFRIRMSVLLLICYAAVFILAIFVPKNFLAVAFDSGGVTTGPMTVPFIMALGLGVSSIRSDKNAENDSFGLVALSSVGPILAVMILSLIYRPEDAAYTGAVLPDVADTRSMTMLFLESLPHYFAEVGIALAPIIVFFVLFQIFALHLPRRQVVRIIAGIVYTYLGLSLFLTGVNVGFMPMGSYLGQALASHSMRWVLVPIGMLMGYFVVSAEPAVHVLSKQVYEVSAGVISPKALMTSLSAGVSVSVGLAMLRVLTGLNILWLLVPGYVISLVMMLFVPPIYTSIAFDSGGVASGPMTATFLLPFAMGACVALGGNVTTDAFGVVAMVAMTPLITIQILGLISKIRVKRSVAQAPVLPEAQEEIIEEIIE